MVNWNCIIELGNSLAGLYQIFDKYAGNCNYKELREVTFSKKKNEFFYKSRKKLKSILLVLYLTY